MMTGEQFLYNRPTFPAQLNFAHPLTRGLVGCWVLNENSPNSMRAWDSSLYKNHGTVTGAQGRWQGRSFDDVDDVIKVPHHSALATITYFTHIFWLYIKSLSSSEPLYSKRDISVGTFPYQAWMATNGVVTFSSSGGNLDSAAGLVAAGEWIHLAFINNNGAFTFMKNGQVFSTGSFPLGSDSGATVGVIFAAPYYISPDAWAPIILGEVLFSNRALSLAEIQQIYLEPYAMFL